MFSVPDNINAAQFVEKLEFYASRVEATKDQSKIRSDKTQDSEGNKFMAVPMRQIFELAKEFIEMPPEQIEKLLESPVHRVRVGALSIMEKQVRRKKELFDLYIRRSDRINNWDLVDLGSPYVVGAYLFNKPRDILYTLAHSSDIWQRRTAIVSTLYFVRQNDTADTFKIAEILLSDEQDLIHKATGGLLREAGQKDRQRLISFLDQYAATMPRTLLPYAIEHLDKEQRVHYMSMKKVS